MGKPATVGVYVYVWRGGIAQRQAHFNIECENIGFAIAKVETVELCKINKQTQQQQQRRRGEYIGLNAIWI